MLRGVCCVALTLAVIGCMGGGRAEERSFALVKDGRPLVEIVKTGDRTVDADIAFFTNAVFRCTGASLPVVPARTPGASAIVFDFAPDELFTADDWQVTFPDPQTLSIRGTAAWSCRWALNEILEKDLGVVFVMPGEFGTHYPQVKTLAVPAQTRTGTSSYKVNRELWREDRAYARALGGKKQPFAFGSYKGHNLWVLFHISKYGEGEWVEKIMPERNGKRQKPKSEISGWQPCLSHPASVPEAVRRALEHLEKHPEDKTMSLAMNDLEGWCECEGCRKMNGGFEKRSEYLPKYVTHSPSYWKWVNAVTEELLKVHPNLLVGTIAYCGTLDPPPFKLNPHISVGLAIDMLQTRDPGIRANREKLIAAWNEKASIVGLDGYDYGSIEYLVPRLYTRLMTDYLCGNKRKYPALNSIFAEGAGGQLSGEGPKRYLYYKAMFQPDFDLDREASRWYEACCGKQAAPFLRAYYEKAEAFWMGEAVTRTGWYKSLHSDYFNFDDQDYVSALTSADLDEATALLKQALAAAKASGDAGQRKRAERLKTFHGYFVHRIRSFCYDCAKPQSAAEATAFLARIPEFSRESRLAFAYADKILAPYSRERENDRWGEFAVMRDGFRSRAYDEVNPLLKERLVAASDYLDDSAVQSALRTALADPGLLPKIGEFVKKLGSIGSLANLVKPDFVERMERERRYRVQGIRPGSDLGVRVRIRNRGEANRNFWLYFAPILPANGSLNGHCSRGGMVSSGETKEFVFFGHVPDHEVWAGVTEGAVGVYDHAGSFSEEDVVVESVYVCDFNEGKE